MLLRNNNWVLEEADKVPVAAIFDKINLAWLHQIQTLKSNENHFVPMFIQLPERTPKAINKLSKQILVWTVSTQMQARNDLYFASISRGNFSTSETYHEENMPRVF